MSEENKGVNGEGLPPIPPSPAVRQRQEQEEKEVVKQEAEATEQPEGTQVPETPVQEEATPASVVPPTNADVDEMGVPWKNRFMEQKRKNEELAERLPQMIDEKLSKFSSPQTPQYTYEQLEAYKLQNTSNTEAVAWATKLQREMSLAETRKQFEEIVGNQTRTQQAEVKRNQSFEYVKKTFPDALNPNHPLFQGVKYYMSNPAIAENPEGLVMAAKAAYADYAMQQTPVLQGKTQQLKQELKQAQKASLTEGGGRKIVNTTTPQASAIERLRKTGSLTDANSAVGIVLKQKGILQE